MTTVLRLAAASLILAVLAAVLAFYRTPVLGLMMGAVSFCR
jgi:hypothetical protein